MRIDEIIRRNYDSAVRRGQITQKSTVADFLAKTDEEVQELKDSTLTESKINPFDPKEAVDIILVQTAMLFHYGYDTKRIMKEKMLYNEKRK